MKESNFQEYVPMAELKEGFSIRTTFFLDLKFWSTGCLNINLHSKELEIEFLCFGLYFAKLNNYE